MPALLAVWSSLFTAALPLPHSSLMSVATGALMLLCAAALWLQRDRPRAPLPRPLQFGNDERLAA